MALTVVDNSTGNPVRRAAAALLLAVSLVAMAQAATTRGVTWARSGASSPAPAAPAPDRLDRDIPATADPVEVVVTAHPGQLQAMRDAVAAVGGAVSAELALVDGVTVRLSGIAAHELVKHTSVRSITLNRTGTFEEESYEDAEATGSVFAKASGATTAWSQGNYGQGVGVAVIDTGVSDMKDLTPRVVHGPDLSGEGTTVDSYGHGTVMAGVIAGSGADSAGRAGGAYKGVAPRAHIVSVKVAGRNGSVDVSTMLQAMHWVNAYKDQFNTRVLSLSWGVPSTQSHTVDPVNYAVQRLWKAGIVVVVAAGNKGPSTGTIYKPGDDPLVVTVGAYDDKGTADGGDDGLASWSSRGPTAAGITKPDVVAPGRTLIATRSFGSAVEKDNPKALIQPSYIKGSGTSQAAALTAGGAALLLQARPSLTPDQVKALLMGTASPLADKTANDQGKGRIRIGHALAAEAPVASQTATSSGLGSIEKSRGGWNVDTDCNRDGVTEPIAGEIDVRCESWDPAAWTGTAWTGTAWTGTAWTGGEWSGTAWTGTAWTGTAWTGTAWTGGTWTGTAWTGTAWTGTAWTGTAWTGTAWTGSAWTGTAWTGTAWTGTAWTGAAYGDDVFLSAFFGDKPKRGIVLPGEQVDMSGSISSLRV